MARSGEKPEQVCFVITVQVDYKIKLRLAYGGNQLQNAAN